MVLVVTRVRSARVEIEGQTVGAVDAGLLILFGAVKGDTEAEVSLLADKAAGLRIFEDDAGKMGRSVEDIGGGILVVPNFTLAANCRKGRRPDFTNAAPPSEADALYNAFVAALRTRQIPVETGVFGGDMQVYSQNDGPVTILLDSDQLGGPRRG